MRNLFLVAGLVLGLVSSLHARDDEPVKSDELFATFEFELAEWTERYEAADGMRARRTLRAEHPAAAFEARFEVLATAGDLRARLWTIEYLDKMNLRSRARDARRLTNYQALVKDFPGQEAALPGLEALLADRRLRRSEGIKTVRAFVNEAIGGFQEEEHRDGLRLGFARVLAKSKDEAEVEEAQSLLEAVIAAGHLDPDELEAASEFLFVLKNLRVGCLAPDFEGTTVDGETIRLSELRGKVVVLDFFGFW